MEIKNNIMKKQKLEKTTEWYEPKYRIQEHILNDNTKMYFPQIYCCVKRDYKCKYWLFGETYVLYIYDWQFLEQDDTGICIRFKKEGTGLGSSDINDAKNWIENYKKDREMRIAKREEKIKREEDSEVKSVNYLDYTN